ncbi:hypothetical protein [Pseudomonas sp.]|uniref:hypothetical protein n=1 Tax=Pseudomonas sp. TaxID=306 RepID=UPI0028998079|nr:hypothetical protein [Pseudomonas sp.]
MKRTIDGLVEAGEPLILEAIAALRRYHEAQDGNEPPVQVERLRLIAESAYQAVTDYQLYAFDRKPLTRH